MNEAELQDWLARCPAETREALARLVPAERDLGLAEVTARPCPALAPGEFCDGAAHYDRDPANAPLPRPAVLRRCPEQCQREIRARITEEEERLGGALAECRGARFADYDVNRQRDAAWCAVCRSWSCVEPLRHERDLVRPREEAKEALDVMQGFAAARPPRQSVILSGGLGLGKTHLMLASHFELLRGGVRSYFVGSTDLRECFARVGSFDDEMRTEAEQLRDALVRAEVIHWDDAGDVDGDQRRRGAFSEGIKFLLDRSRAVWAVSLNGDYEAARKHPDLGPKIISRLMQNAVVVRMRGSDQRLGRGSR